MIFGRKAKFDINDISRMLTSIGIVHRFDEDGDITFSMRLPGRATRERDGSPDWEPLRYRIQEDWSIAGEFTDDIYDRTDMAKRVVRIHFMGSGLRSGKLKFQAFAKVVPEKFGGNAYIDVVLPAGVLDVAKAGMQSVRFRDGSTGVVGAVTGRFNPEGLRALINSITETAGDLIARQFTGVMIQGRP